MASPTLKRLTAGALPVLALLVLVLLSLHLMSSAVQNTEELSRLFIPLLIASVIGLFAMVVVVGVNIAQLFISYRRHAAGSRLTTRLAAVFVVLSLVPVTVVFYYSQQFLSQGIDSWFNVQVDQAMEDALELSRASLDLHKRDRLKTTQNLLLELSGSSIAALSLSLESLRDRFGASELALLRLSGEPIAVSNADPTVLVPSESDSTILQQVRAGSDFVGIAPSGSDGDLQVKVVVMDPERSLFLRALYPTSINITNLTATVQSAYNRYRELAFLRKSLKHTFTLALGLVLLFSLLGAMWAAFHTARRLVAPIADIAEGTRAVAKGDYDMQLPLPRRRDELGFLVASFNAMTKRLAQARDEAARSKRQVEAQRAYLGTVLGRLSSGVMALDASGHIRTANQAASDILRVDIGRFLGQPLESLGGGTSPQLQQFIDATREPMARESREWREQITLFSSEGRQVLLCRGTSLAQPEGASAGYVLVFDDITALIKAQRDAAWGEVARRLAHEIKNPLTPIQLSAERLRRKYLHKMAPEDAAVLDRATRTIVQQVEAMKEMVNAFSDYAKPPKMHPEPVKVDNLVSEVMDLYRSAGLDSRFTIQLQAGEATIEADPLRLRQVVHNLVKNAQEAVAEREQPQIEVSTRVVQEGECDFMELRVTDNGPGFDEETMAHLFEPYVTTKKKGTGLGMAVVKKIVEEHGGQIWAENRSRGGACVILRLPILNPGPGKVDCGLPADPETRREEA
ncbi:MAG TPA: HAMP domain-containing protein [Sedimenticola sp.]|nr:HAMP domain-containing protein [Sedimenticola sp.]